MREDWAMKQVNDVMDGYQWNARRRLSVSALKELSAKLLRQRDAAWKRAVKKLWNDADPNGPNMYAYKRALGDVLAAMTRPRKGGGG